MIVKLKFTVVSLLYWYMLLLILYELDLDQVRRKLDVQ